MRVAQWVVVMNLRVLDRFDTLDPSSFDRGCRFQVVVRPVIGVADLVAVVVAVVVEQVAIDFETLVVTVLVVLRADSGRKCRQCNNGYNQQITRVHGRVLGHFHRS